MILIMYTKKIVNLDYLCVLFILRFILDRGWDSYFSSFRGKSNNFLLLGALLLILMEFN